jgi:quercetin dioxygenase-like cupin family protein
MAIIHARPGELVDLHPRGEDFAAAATKAIVRNERFEVIRLVVPKGHKIPPHRVAGPITVQCLSGKVSFSAGDQTQELTANQWLFLQGNEPHSLTGVEDALVLVTIMFPR